MYNLYLMLIYTIGALDMLNSVMSISQFFIFLTVLESPSLINTFVAILWESSALVNKRINQQIYKPHGLIARDFFLHAKLWIPGGVKSIFMVVIH